MFDKNENGRISMAELGEMLTNLGKSVPTEVAAHYWIKSCLLSKGIHDDFHFVCSEGA